MKILLVGLTTRAIAESAIRAGYDIVTVDYFGDLDQKRLCENVSLRERRVRYGAAALLEATRGVTYDAVAYAGGLENAPDIVAALTRDRTLLGNDPATLQRVRDPSVLFSFLASRGWEVPRVIWPGEPMPPPSRPEESISRTVRPRESVLRATRPGESVPPPSQPEEPIPRTNRPGGPPPGIAPPAHAFRGGTWVQKPVRGGGGQGVRIWRGRPLSAGQMLQEYVEGVPASAAFVADGRRSVVFGWTEQLRGSSGFRYGGNILPLDGPPAAADEVRAITDALTVEFGLRGLNGLDFVLRDGRPVTLEVNPRYSASMELIERATGISVFRLHLGGCSGSLPDPAVRHALDVATTAPTIAREVWGKAIAYAPRTLSVGDTTGWIGRDIRDVPHRGEVIRGGSPICTVFATAPTHVQCRQRLRAEVTAVLVDCGVAHR
jgi:uncharacterized protein